MASCGCGKKYRVTQWCNERKTTLVAALAGFAMMWPVRSKAKHMKEQTMLAPMLAQTLAPANAGKQVFERQIPQLSQSMRERERLRSKPDISERGYL